MSAPTPSDLDYTQTLQGAYDDAKGAFRVEAQITAPLDVNGEVLVDVKAEDGDSVLLAGTTNGSPTGPVQYVKVNPDGSINVTETATIVSTSANLSSITSLTSSQIIFTLNTARKGFILFNNSTANCFIAFASTASSSLFTIQLNSGMTYQDEGTIYVGPISAIWASANGFLAVTELV
jgi:hypothetical protein